MSFKPGIVTLRQLSVADRDSCVTVENSAFANPDHRATPEKFAYRLTVCPELCMGVFVRDDESSSSETLVGHIVSTRLKTHVITDDDMDVPPTWRDALAAAPASASFVADVGHQPNGTTVGVHSLGIVPSAQGRGLGTRLMAAYLEHMAQLSAAAAASPSGSGPTKVSGVALICQDYLIKYYEKFGYKSHGPSKAHFGSGGWTDMVYDVPQ